ncbi:MAG: 23S rRNA (adenine(2503)-C(2))-methyltransferase RlmN [Oscillospiraceae bacterium]|jgi:23S rRNA (adenine2503-C2)-methyltransferase|nr:23S rRNA (adenine(2503)-C(2))-methyltransferase RlmN [Oscillospiraceae bacterium]
MPNIKEYSVEDINALFVSWGQKPYRAKQVIRWLYGRGVRSFSEMTDLSEELRTKLTESFTLNSPELAEQRDSADGTTKYLWRYNDGNTVESVLLNYRYGTSVCVSTQAGCRMGCKFCASPDAGFARNLTASEILDQVLFAQLKSGTQIGRIDLMGIGEPLDNFDNVVRFITLVRDPLFSPGGRAKGSAPGLNIGMRHITVSTCGLVPQIAKFAELEIPCNLSVSLHAPDDETRSALMPVNNRYNIAELIDCCERYYNKLNRRITFQYALIKGVNDSPAQAKLLAGLMRKVSGHVNLIHLNDTGNGLKAGDDRAFGALLLERGATVTTRRSLGADIDAACGMLRRRTIEKGQREVVTA